MQEIEVKTTLYVTEDGEKFDSLELAQEHKKHLEAVKKLETFKIDGPSCTPFNEVTIHAYDWQWYKVNDHDELDQVLRLIYKAYGIGHIRYFWDKCSKFPQYIGVSCNHKCMTTLAEVEQKHNLEMIKWENFYYAFKNDLKKDRESAVNKVKMTIEDHIRNLDDIMDSMPDNACDDWRDSLAYAIEDLQQKNK